MTRGRAGRVEEEILARRDPKGYYVIVASRESLKLLAGMPGVVVEEHGDLAVIKVKARSLARRIVRMLASRNLLRVG